ncbi:mitochondrial carrier [Serendipita vermifera]|nr:mitochondrial carrier [Serendipita vermifera]
MTGEADELSSGREKSSSHLRVVGAFAGIGSGLTKVAVGHGFDTVKTRIQVAPSHYNGAIDCFLKIIRREGPLALYKGATPPAVGWAAIDSVLLGSLHNYRLHLKNYPIFSEPSPPRDDSTRLTLFGHGVAGLGAGLTSAFVATPIELVKVKLQLQHQVHKSDRQFKGPIDCARQIFRVQGVRGFWRGLAGSLAFRANFFWMFLTIEALMRASSRLEGTGFQMSEGTANFICGGLASFTYWFAAIPADNVKNRVFGSPLDSSTTVRQVISDIYRTAGIRGFYRGLAPSILRAFPSNACAYFVYEGLLRTFGAEKTRA